MLPRMKYLLLVVFLAVAVVLTGLYLPLRDGRPLLAGDRLDNVFREMETVSGGNIPESLKGQGTPSYYKWRGPNGNWQYGDRPPPGVDAEPVKSGRVQTLTPDEIRGAPPESEDDGSG